MQKDSLIIICFFPHVLQLFFLISLMCVFYSVCGMKEAQAWSQKLNVIYTYGNLV